MVVNYVIYRKLGHRRGKMTQRYLLSSSIGRLVNLAILSVWWVNNQPNVNLLLVLPMLFLG